MKRPFHNVIAYHRAGNLVNKCFLVRPLEYREQLFAKPVSLRQSRVVKTHYPQLGNSSRVCATATTTRYAENGIRVRESTNRNILIPRPPRALVNARLIGSHTRKDLSRGGNNTTRGDGEPLSEAIRVRSASASCKRQCNGNTTVA